MSMKNSIETIGNRTRDLPACSAVPQSTAPLRVPKPKHVGAFIVLFNVNFNILKEFKCALVGQIKKLIFGYEES
jgi:hypothetical protein